MDTQHRGYLIREDISEALAKMGMPRLACFRTTSLTAFCTAGGDPAKVNEIVSAMKPDAHGHIVFVEFEKWLVQPEVIHTVD